FRDCDGNGSTMCIRTIRMYACPSSQQLLQLGGPGSMDCDDTGIQAASSASTTSSRSKLSRFHVSRWGAITSTPMGNQMRLVIRRPHRTGTTHTVGCRDPQVN